MTLRTPTPVRSFDDWMREVNRVIAAHAGGMTADDIDDCDYRAMWRDRRPPLSAAKRALRLAGWRGLAG